MVRIFDIVRSSFVDGPGIRTSVFFLGCNLNCKWCHNPESRSPAFKIMHDREKCVGCNKCGAVCKFGAIDRGIYDSEKCTYCGDCETFCPVNALEVCGKEMSEEDVFREIIKDKAFYGQDGGATFSGGECMLQTEGLIGLLTLCKENGIITAVDTAGSVPFSYFQKVMPLTDVFLYDVKLATPELHKKWTGVDNGLILSNLKRLSDSGCRIIIRIPVIGGVNDNREEMKKISGILSSVRYEKVELLPYHELGNRKYSALSLPVPEFYVPDNEKIKEYKKLFNA